MRTNCAQTRREHTYFRQRESNVNYATNTSTSCLPKNRDLEDLSVSFQPSNNPIKMATATPLPDKNQCAICKTEIGLKLLQRLPRRLLLRPRSPERRLANAQEIMQTC